MRACDLALFKGAEAPSLVALCDHWSSCRLGCGSRYPAGLVLSIPCALVLFQGQATKEPWRQRFGKSFVYCPRFGSSYPDLFSDFL